MAVWTFPSTTSLRKNYECDFDGIVGEIARDRTRDESEPDREEKSLAVGRIKLHDNADKFVDVDENSKGYEYEFIEATSCDGHQIGNEDLYIRRVREVPVLSIRMHERAFRGRYPLRGGDKSCIMYSSCKHISMRLYFSVFIVFVYILLTGLIVSCDPFGLKILKLLSS